MIKKIYNISGFDCANCAAKAENHLSKNKNIEYAHLDFAGNKLYLTFKDNEYSLEEIKKIIAEVESDPIELSEYKANSKKSKGEKKVYNISGFDCANCAAKAEAHLNRDENINYCRLDFAGNRLYLNYKDEEYSIEQIKKIIAEVESDPIDITESDGNIVKKNPKIFNKSMWILLARILVATVFTVVAMVISHDYHWVRFAFFLAAVLILIYDVFYKVVNHIIHRENILDHNLLIVICTVGAFVLASLETEPHTGPMAWHDEHMEAVMVVGLFQIGRIIESYATNKSKAAIMSAVELRVEYANVVKEGQVFRVRPEDLSIGDTIIIKTGELIPSDCTVIEGEAYIDTSSLTGEYVPILAKAESKLYSGCLVKNGTVTANVNKKYEDSTVAKIIELIGQGGEKKSKADEFISKFAKFYTPIVCGLAIIAMLIGGFATQDWTKWILIGLEILVTGCPCAIIISVPLAYFSGIGLSSKNGIVVKGTSYIDALNDMGILICDKTGTLTHGSFKIQKIHAENLSEEEFLNYLYAAECLSTHPIGKAICHEKNLRTLANEQRNFKEVAGLGVETQYKKKHIVAGSVKYLEANDVSVEGANEIGTVVYVAVDKKYVGYVVLSDEVKEDAQPMVDLLHHDKVEIVLLTGDKEANAKQICNNLGIDRWHSELLPEQKVDYLELEMKESKKSVAFIGDGINDAPSIIRSDIGIAMGGIGSDIAVENADIVIMNDDPAKVYDAKKIAKMARNTSIFNIAFALVIKFAVMILAVLDVLPELMMTIAVIADTGLTVLLVINSLLLLYRKVKRPLLKSRA